MVIHVTPWPPFQILSTRYIITLTNLVCRIGLIWIITCPSPNTMNKIGIITTTLHRVNGDTTFPSHIVNHLTNIQLQIILLPNSHRRINWLGKENGSLNELKRRIQILEDSKSCQNFQITDRYSIFQEKHADLEKSIEYMI